METFGAQKFFSKSNSFHVITQNLHFGSKFTDFTGFTELFRFSGRAYRSENLNLSTPQIYLSDEKIKKRTPSTVWPLKNIFCRKSWKMPFFRGFSPLREGGRVENGQNYFFPCLYTQCQKKYHIKENLVSVLKTPLNIAVFDGHGAYRVLNLTV